MLNKYTFLFFITIAFLFNDIQIGYSQTTGLVFSPNGNYNLYVDSLVYVQSLNGIYHKIERTEDSWIFRVK